MMPVAVRLLIFVLQHLMRSQFIKFKIYKPLTTTMSLRYLSPLLAKQAAYSLRSQLPCCTVVASRHYSGLKSQRLPTRKLSSIVWDQHQQDTPLPLAPTTPSTTSTITAWKTTYEPPIPNYLTDVYWWAYVQKSSIRLLDNQFLVNMVLWGNANTLRDAALEGLDNTGRTLQVACVYGNFTEGLMSRLSNSTVDVIDVVPEQLHGLKRKIDRLAIKDNQQQQQGQPSIINDNQLHLSCYNAEHMVGFENETFDQTVFYMLLHEMPNDVRRNTIQEALRVLKPGGKMVFIDFHRPEHLWRRFFISVWFLLEPFARDLWSTEIMEWFPETAAMQGASVQKEVYAGGLFQRVIVTKPH
jgi:ubiquinone/menaquinone biosynthesis C-methylase UbiE